MRYVLLALIAIGMMTYALIDCVRTDDPRIRMGLPKAFWVVIIIVVPIAGGLTWLILSGLNRRRYEGGPSGRPTRPKAPPAPDDDPDFLFRLERDRRRAQKKREASEGRGAPTPSPTSPSEPPSEEERPQPERDLGDEEDLLYVPEEFQDLPLDTDDTSDAGTTSDRGAASPEQREGEEREPGTPPSGAKSGDSAASGTDGQGPAPRTPGEEEDGTDSDTGSRRSGQDEDRSEDRRPGDPANRHRTRGSRAEDDDDRR